MSSVIAGTESTVSGSGVASCSIAGTSDGDSMATGSANAGIASVAGSVPLKNVPPVTLPPCIIFSLTGFQIFAPGGGLNAGPYFHLAGSNGP